MDEQPLAIETTELELIEFGFTGTSAFRPEEFQRVLLTCGHYSRPIFNASSQWDFPDDEHRCPTCGQARQWDLRVQAEVMAQRF
jgi:hypothetical protein